MFRVLTFNLRGATFDDGSNIWPNRAALCARVIREADPDLIGFQECEMGNHVYLREALPAWEHHLGWPLDQPGRFLHNGVAWRRERFRLTDAGSFYLSRTPRTWSKDWDSSLVRGATWVLLRERKGGREVFLLNAHLDHLGERARLEGARLLAEKARELAGDRPVLLTGDFNCAAPLDGSGSADPPYAALRAAGFGDAIKAAPPAERIATFHGFHDAGSGAPSPGPGALRIDWILYRGAIRPVDYQVIQTAEPPLYPSDHYPVLATFALSDD